MTIPFLAFGMPGGPEWILIFLVLLLLFGAKKLPELARGIGRSLGEFKKAKEDFEAEITDAERAEKQEQAKKSASAKPSEIQDAEEVENTND